MILLTTLYSESAYLITPYSCWNQGNFFGYMGFHGFTQQIPGDVVLQYTVELG